jgi:hypothetical protein
VTLAIFRGARQQKAAKDSVVLASAASASVWRQMVALPCLVCVKAEGNASLGACLISCLCSARPAGLSVASLSLALIV